MRTYLTAIVFCLLGPILSPAQNIYTGQGLLAGEVTDSSVILQMRLTSAEGVIDGDVPGVRGVGCFELSTRDDFKQTIRTAWMDAKRDNDFLIKTKVEGLQPGTLYYCRPWTGRHPKLSQTDVARSFKTLPGSNSSVAVSFVVGGAMNYESFRRNIALKSRGLPSAQAELDLGPEVFSTLHRLRPDFYVSTGNNVAYDDPDIRRAVTEEAMRVKWHEQFVQPRLAQFFSIVPAYWMKNDRDYRFRGAFPEIESISDKAETPAASEQADEGDELKAAKRTAHELGVRVFREQVPVVDLSATNAVTYRTQRPNRHLQLWFLESRDYRSPNTVPDGPGKTLWGKAQREWLQATLKESDATFKLLVSPTPLIGPDEAGHRDNHTTGFQHERDSFLAWLKENGLGTQRVFILCGGLGWQHHALHPSGYEEFGCGPIHGGDVASTGLRPGDARSTDPRAQLRLFHISPKPMGGYLHIKLGAQSAAIALEVSFHDETGKRMYGVQRMMQEK